MRLLPKDMVVHRWCPRADAALLVSIGQSRDGRLEHFARLETVAAYRRMNEEASLQKVHLHVIWAYRASMVQKDQFEEAKKKYGPRHGIKWLAPPGFSEHQTGWVLDIGDKDDSATDDNPLFERTKAFEWLKQNASRFHFELSFLPGNWQGVSYEPWHWRYIGSEPARRAFHPTGVRAVLVWGRSLVEALRWWLHP